MSNRIQRLRERYGDKIRTYIEQLARDSDDGEAGLPRLLNYQLETGGKRLRALLPIAHFEAIGEDPHRAMPLAAACELIHNATLVHDDIQDRDIFRRGNQSVWHKFGVDRAINLGDAGFFWALKSLCELDLPADQHRQLQRRTTEAVGALIEGQDMECRLARSSEPPLFDKYLAIARRKTGRLLSVSLAGAGVVAGASEPRIDALDEVGERLGIAYQLQDDLVDLYAPETKGHQRGSDIREGTWSSPLIFGANQGDELCEKITAIVDKSADQIDDSEIQTIAEKLEEKDVPQTIVGKIEKNLDLISARLRQLEHPELERCYTDMMETIFEPTDDI